MQFSKLGAFEGCWMLVE